MPTALPELPPKVLRNLAAMGEAGDARLAETA
jgi:hypothetical protein